MARKKVAQRRHARPYTEAEIAQISAAMAEVPPPTWGTLGRLLDRHPMGVRDKWRQLTEQRADGETKVYGKIGNWPSHAVFTSMTMKPLYQIPAPTTPACFLPRAQQLPGASAPGFSIQLPAASNAPPIPGRGPEAGSATSPLAEPARLSTGAE
jgi:hypothetical protein